jgi:hypothetical protein
MTVETTMMRGTQRATIGPTENRGGGELAATAAKLESLVQQLEAAPADQRDSLRQRIRELAATIALLARSV